MASSSPAFLLPTKSLLSRPQSRAPGDIEFDSGINSSNAWTVSLTAPSEGVSRTSAVIDISSLSDEEPDGYVSDANDDDIDHDPGRPARALYRFEGKPEFRELTCVEAGDELEVLKEDAGEGWSLAKNLKCKVKREVGHKGEIGLLPRTYYIFTAEFALLPGFELPSLHSRSTTRREASGSSITPRGSPTLEAQPLPLVPQTTEEWFPSFRKSLLGGRSLNRFSSFVTSGAEEWVLQGSAEETVPPTSHGRSVSEQSLNGENGSRLSMLSTAGETERHFVEVGPTWKTKAPVFRVLVHSPSKRNSTLSGAYTVYTITSVFDTQSHTQTASDPPPNTEDTEGRPNSPIRITVHRRFSHFVVLHTALIRRLPGIALPPLPEKQYAGRFNDEFVEARRGDLERYLNRVVKHPIARYGEVLTFFLGCENDTEWKRQLPTYLALPPKGSAFYAQVFHPAFNLDAEDAAEAVERFEGHTRAVGRSVQSLRNIFGKVREARIEMSKAERLLSYSLLSLITSKPLASAPATGFSEDGAEEIDRLKGHLNEDGAWCWREGCGDCLKMTKAMQKTAETLQSVADLYEDHARRTQLATHEALKNVAHPSTLYEAVVDTHKSTLSRYHDAIREGCEDEEVAARCETVLNTTMAEMNTYHAQKVEDFQTLAKEHLDGEIALYEQILTRLRNARRVFDPPQYDNFGKTPRQPSIYERELEHPRLTPAALTQPCPHVFDSAPMRPVSVAIQEGVGMLLGGVGSPGRASVFGKFW